MGTELTETTEAASDKADAPKASAKSCLGVTGPKPDEEVLPLHVDILRNLRSGVTLGLVNLPLAVSLAIAGGGTPEMGALSAAWGSLIGGFLNGSHFTLIAPTGGLSGVLSNFSQQYGQACLPWLAIFASIITFVVYALNLHQFLTIIPVCGMTGFKLGIGTIIGLNQLNLALGLNPDTIPNWHKHEHFYERVGESLIKAPEHTKPWNPAFFLFNMVPLLYLVRYAKNAKVRQVPWHIIFVVAGIIYGYLLDVSGNQLELMLLQDRFNINPYLIGTDETNAFFSVQGTKPESLNWGGIVVASFSVTIIAILETQIAAKILDALTGTEFDSKRELFGTGMCNLVAGLAGGMPICGAMARMTLNATCGARSRVSIIINGVTVVILMFALFPLFKFCPMPVLAAVLVPVAISMIKLDVVAQYWRYDKGAFIQCMLVFLVCVFLDPTYAIGVAILMGLWREAREFSLRAAADCSLECDALEPAALLPTRVAQPEDNAPSAGPKGAPFYRPLGHWTYTNKVIHGRRIKEIRKRHDAMVLDFSGVHLMDLDGYLTIEPLLSDANGMGRVHITGLRPNILEALRRFPWFKKAEADGKVGGDGPAEPAHTAKIEVVNA